MRPAPLGETDWTLGESPMISEKLLVSGMLFSMKDWLMSTVGSVTSSGVNVGACAIADSVLSFWPVTTTLGVSC
jgi:hypothetical protein